MTSAPAPSDTTRPPSSGSPHSIASRLRRLVMLSVAIALLLATSFNVWFALQRYIASKSETLLATANVFGSTASRAVRDRDDEQLSRVLTAIARIPGLRYAEVRDNAGTLLADLGEGSRLVNDAALDGDEPLGVLEMLRSRSIRISVPIVNSGEVVGHLHLVSDTAGLAGQLLSSLASVGGSSLVALLLGLVLASRLQRQITAPLVALATAMKTRGRDNEYDRVPETAQDRETLELARTFNDMVTRIREATDEILARESEIIGRLSRAAEHRDDETGQHVQRVAVLSRLIGTQLNLDRQFVDDLYRASPMHDVGKLSIPDAILYKTGRLTPKERAVVEGHPQAGYDVLSGSGSKLVQLAAEVALTHHERWDGRGYPHKLCGLEIPLSGRITAVADVCDALLTERPYKKAWPLAEVRDHLISRAGTHFDPDCVAALLIRWREVERLYAQRPDALEGPSIIAA